MRDATYGDWRRLSAATMSKRLLLSLLALSLGLVRLAADDRPDWRQVRAEISYVRTGTLATAPEGKFTFTLSATVDQLLRRHAPEGSGYPTYFMDDAYQISARVAGQAVLEATAEQSEEGKTYRASASLKSALAKPEEFVVGSVEPAGDFGPGMMAKLPVNLLLTGTVASTYPRFEDVSVEDQVLLWPTPVAHDAEAGFVSQGEWFIRPRPSSESKAETPAALASMIEAVNGLEYLPGLGGFRPLGLGATTRGQGEEWELTLQASHAFETLTGGSYTETVKVRIVPVKTDLPLPQLRPVE